MSQEYSITRTGDRPLVFTGELIAVADGRFHAGQEQNRWHEIRIYRTSGGKYVLQVDYFTRWQGEDNVHYASTHDSAEALANALKVHDPLENVLGYPPHPQFAGKQARLEESLRLRWGTLVSKVLAEIPEAAERIE